MQAALRQHFGHLLKALHKTIEWHKKKQKQSIQLQGGGPEGSLCVRFYSGFEVQKGRNLF